MQLVNTPEGLEIPEDHVVYDVSSLENPIVEASNYVTGVSSLIVQRVGDKHFMIVHKDAQVNLK